MARQKFGEGDWFAVPLPDGKFATGVVARTSKKYVGTLLGYFFGPRREELAALSELESLSASQAVLVGRFGYLGLRGGAWPVLGRLEPWIPSDWPMPVFVRYEELTGRVFRVFYADADPSVYLREEQVPPGHAITGPKDSGMGAGFVELRLNQLLGGPT
jgi:Immunity protein 26